MTDKMLDINEERKKNEKQRQKLCLREKEIQKRECDLRGIAIELQAKINENSIKENSLRMIENELMKCESPESRDKVRMAFIFEKMCKERLSNRWADTEYIKGLANILTGVKAEEKQEGENDRNTKAEMQGDI